MLQVVIVYNNAAYLTLSHSVAWTVKMQFEFFIKFFVISINEHFSTRKMNVFLTSRSGLGMFSFSVTRYVMAMIFRKISTMFFKVNYGFVFFFS